MQNAGCVECRKCRMPEEHRKHGTPGKRQKNAGGREERRAKSEDGEEKSGDVTRTPRSPRECQSDME